VFSSFLTNPFIVAHPETLKRTIEALNCTLKHCWPRVRNAEHMGRLVRMLSICWINLSDASNFADRDVGDIQDLLKHTGVILRGVWPDAGRGMLTMQIEELLEREACLQELFGTDMLQKDTTLLPDGGGDGKASIFNRGAAA